MDTNSVPILLNSNTNKEVSEKIWRSRSDALSHLFKISVVMVGLGAVSTVLGIVILSMSYGADFPVTSGVQIWSGCTILTAGILGIAASRFLDVNYVGAAPPRFRNLFTAHYTFSIMMLSFGGLNFGYSIWSASICSDESACGPNHKTEVGLTIAATPLAFLMFVMGLVGTIFFLMRRKLFVMLTLKEMLLYQKIQSLEDRVQTLQNSAQQQGYGTQYGFQGDGTQPVHPPPSYSDVKTY